MRRSSDLLTLLALSAVLAVGSAAPAPGRVQAPASPELSRAVLDGPAALHPSVGVRGAVPTTESGPTGRSGGGVSPRAPVPVRLDRELPSRGAFVRAAVARDLDFRASDALARAGTASWCTADPPPLRSV